MNRRLAPCGRHLDDDGLTLNETSDMGAEAMLNVATAKQIVRAVVKDSKSRKRIDSTLARVMPNSLGITGSLRNLGMIALNMDPTDPKVSALTCVGIADASSDAITAARIPGVKSSTSRDRDSWNVAHTAILEPFLVGCIA